jgi:hypothetical protein
MIREHDFFSVDNNLTFENRGKPGSGKIATPYPSPHSLHKHRRRHPNLLYLALVVRRTLPPLQKRPRCTCAYSPRLFAKDEVSDAATRPILTPPTNRDAAYVRSAARRGLSHPGGENETTEITDPIYYGRVTADI